MKTLKETAQAYEPPKTLNIADLESFDINEPVEVREGTTKEGKDFTYFALVRNGEDYRIPNGVVNDIKNIIAVNEKHGKTVNTMTVEVKDRGTKNANYSIVTLDVTTKEPKAD